MDSLKRVGEAQKELFYYLDICEAYEFNVKDLRKLVQQTAKLVQNASTSSEEAYIELLRGVLRCINQGMQFVHDVSRMTRIERALKVVTLEEQLGAVVEGLRDTLSRLESDCLGLSQHHLRLLKTAKADLDRYWTEQQQANARLASTQKALKVRRGGSNADEGRMGEVVQSLLERFDINPKKLAQEVEEVVRQECTAQAASSGSSPGEAAQRDELQVGLIN